MTQCAHCGSHIPDDDSAIHYFVNDVSPEIISIIEQQKGAVFTDLNDEICQTCFTNATEKLCKLSSSNDKSKVKRGRPKRWSSEYKQVEQDNMERKSTGILCVWCKCSLHSKRTHAIPDGPEKKLLSELIYPREIPLGGLACHRCWVYVSSTVRKTTEKNKCSNGARKERDPYNTCVHCLYSLSFKRKHPLPEGPIRDEIADRIFPRQIPEGGLVCYACWLNARRFVERRLQREKDASQEEVVEDIEEQPVQEIRYVRLSKYRRFCGDIASCAAGCVRPAIRASLAVRCRLLASQNVYLPGPARLCRIHSHPDAVLKFHEGYLSNKFTGDQIADMLFLMKRNKPLDADNIEAIDQHVRRIWLGVTWEEFLAKARLHPSIPPRAVAIRLCAMTSGESPEVLASLFQLPRNEIDDALRVAKQLDHTKQLDNTKQLDHTKQLDYTKQLDHIKQAEHSKRTDHSKNLHQSDPVMKSKKVDAKANATTTKVQLTDLCPKDFFEGKTLIPASMDLDTFLDIMSD